MMAFEPFRRPRRGPTNRWELPPGELTTTDVIRLADVTYRQVDYWCRNGLLDPDGNGRGSGVVRRWTATDVDVVRVLGVLARLGARRSALEAAVVTLRRVLGSGARSGWLVVCPDGSVSWAAAGSRVNVVDAAWVVHVDLDAGEESVAL